MVLADRLGGARTTQKALGNFLHFIFLVEVVGGFRWELKETQALSISVNYSLLWQFRKEKPTTMGRISEVIVCRRPGLLPSQQYIFKSLISFKSLKVEGVKQDIEVLYLVRQGTEVALLEEPARPILKLQKLEALFFQGTLLQRKI